MPMSVGRFFFKFCYLIDKSLEYS
uniref:Uncharacterized protein n=1 Tax=Lepeophtheirus salmonis TaxID=72036 RepID=A0A0K2T936_LEPSM